MKKNRSKIARIGIVANCHKPLSREIVRRAASLIAQAGRTVTLHQPAAERAGLRSPALPSVAELSRESDLLLVFGGDGTMLGVARELDGCPTPVLGINLGGLGFLTDVSSNDLPKALRQLWAGQYTIEARALIKASGESRERRLACSALNDIVVSRGLGSRLIELEVRVDGEILTTFRCDGLIVSSPTGSTAYSLAAGGAIVAPNAEVFALTPICPHTLSNRSVIVGLTSVIEVKALSEKPQTILSADGQGESVLAPGDVARIRRSQHRVRMMHLAGTSFFKTLRQKLQWSGSHLIQS